MLGHGAVGELALGEIPGRTHTQTISIAPQATASTVKEAAAVRSISVTTSSFLTRAVGAIRLVAGTCTPASIKSITYAISTAASAAVTVLTPHLFARTFNVTIGATASTVRRTGKVVTAQIAAVVAWTRALYRVASTAILQKPVDYVVEWMVPLKDVRGTEYEIPAAQRSEKTRVTKSSVKRYGAPSTFTVRTNKRGYD